MKSKIINVLFALVLMLGFSLEMAAPVAAHIVPMRISQNPTGVTVADVPVVPYGSDSTSQFTTVPSANVTFNTDYMYTVPAGDDSFTNNQVTGNDKIWYAGLNGASIPLDNVDLNLAGSTSLDWEDPTPKSISGSNYEWDFGTLATGGDDHVNVGLNNSPSIFTPGFDASRSANATTFSNNGDQILTVSVKPKEDLTAGSMNIGVGVQADQYVTPAIDSSVYLNGEPLDNTDFSTDGHNLNINLNNPTTTTYTYTITLHLVLNAGVTQLKFMPSVLVNANQPVAGASGSVTGTSVSDATTGAGTWTWHSDNTITWNWGEVLSHGVHFQGYSGIPSANVNFNTNYNYNVPAGDDSFTNHEVTGNNKGWASGLNGASVPLDNVDLNLASSTSFGNISPTPTSISGANYEWDFKTVPTGGNPNVNVGLNSPVTFTPGFDASRSANQTIFSDNEDQILTVIVTPEETLTNGGIHIGVNAQANQYVTPTIDSSVALNGAPLDNTDFSTDGHNLNINLNNPTASTPYTYTITLHLVLNAGVTQLEFMPNVNVNANQRVAGASGSVTGISVSEPANDYSNSGATTELGTWTWTSTDSITWYWDERLNQGVNFQSYYVIPSANVNFNTNYNYNVPASDNGSFTDQQVTAENTNWGSNLNGPSISLANVNLNLAGSTSFDNENSSPTVTPTINGSNYEWDFGAVSTGGNASANVGLNNTTTPTYTPGFAASRTVDQTTFPNNTSGTTQTLTVSVTPDQALSNINIGVNVQADSYVNPTIDPSVTPTDGAPTNNINLSTDGHNLNININSPTTTTYSYTITIHLTLINGVTQLEFMPNVNVNASQSVAHGSSTGTSFSHAVTGAGTWTWSSDTSVTWNWNEGISQGVNFQGYSAVPSANVVSITDYSYGVSGDSFTNAEVTGKENWFSNLTWCSVPLDNVDLNLASSTSFDNFPGPTQPTSITGSTGSYDYQWDFGTIPAGSGASGEVGLNNSPITLTPGFDASSIADNTTFKSSNGLTQTQTLTVNVTPGGTFLSIGISVNVAEDQYVNPTIESVTPAGGAPTTYGMSNGGKNLFFPINGPKAGTTYTYTITIQLTLQPGVTQLQYMPWVGIYAFQLGATGGSVTGTSIASPTTGAGTWTWSSTASIIWNWVDGLAQCVYFQPYEAAASTVTPVILQSLAITPPAPSVAAGNTLALTATGTYSNSTLSNLTATTTGTIWASLNPKVATVSINGVVTGVTVGTATITANNNGASASVTVTVTAPVLVSITVAPANPTVVAGQTQQFKATGTYSDASTADITSLVTWTSGTPATATINTTGLATAVSPTLPNSSTITAALGNVTGSTSLTVTSATLSKIELTPGSASIAAGRTQQFTATGTYSDSKKQDLTAMVNWTSSDTTKATIAASGLATTIAAGPTNITATLNGVTSNTAALTVTPAALVSITVTPANPSVAKGLTQQFIATGIYSDGTTQNLTATASWTSTDITKATIGTTTGLATGTGIGSTTITANVGGASGANGSATLTVSPAILTSIAVTPATGSIAAGQTQQFTATGTYSDNTTQDITGTATWTSSNIAAASINAAGLATGAFAGSTTISAVQGGVSTSLAPGHGATLTVTSAVVTAVNVTPANPTIVLGGTQQFRAIAVYSNGSKIEVTATANWTSSDTTKATIAASGLATTITAGPTNITATFHGITSNPTVLTVTAATLTSIAIDQVEPVEPSVAAGKTFQFTATGTYDNATTSDVTLLVSWSSSNTSIAKINGAGLALSFAPGTTTITAALTGVPNATATLMVTTPVPISITVTPGSPSLTFISGTGNAPTLQFTATGNYSDGTTANLTNTASWSSSNSATANIVPGGLATAAANGTTIITATFTPTFGSKSGTALLTVLPDTVAPVVTLTSPNEGMVLSDNSLNISGSVDDKSAATTAIINGGTPIILVLDSSGNFSQGVLLNVGNNTIQVMATDSVGNTGSSGTHNIIVDPNKPAVAITSPANGLLTNVASQTVTGTVTGATTVTLMVNGVTNTPTITSGAFTATITLTEGKNIITASAYATGHDGDTNYLGTSGIMTVTLDTIAPVVTINAPAAGGIVSSAGVAVSGTINDTSISTALLILNNGTPQAVPVIGGSFSQNITLVSGANTIAVKATDSVGNTSASAPITVTLDNTKPSVFVTAPANNLMTNAASVTVTGTTDDLTGTGTLYLNGVSQSLSIAPDGSFSLAVPLVSGGNTIEVRVADQATPPNVGTSGTITVTLDTTAPVLTIGLSDPTESTTITVSSDKSLASIPTVTVGATSVAMTSIAMNEWTGTYGSAAVPIAAGDYIVTVTGVDNAGNQATATSSFFKNTISVDGVNPTLVDPVSTSLSVQTYGVVSGASISVTTSLQNPSGNAGNPNGASIAGGAFVEINASTTLRDNLNQIYIQVYYDPAELPPGTDESSLKLYLWDVTQGIWQLVPNSGVDTTDHYIYGTVNHLSNFGIFGSIAVSPTPTPAPVSGGSSIIPVTTNGWNASASTGLKVHSNGIVQNDVTLTTTDGKVTLQIPKDTKLLTSSGSALLSLSAAVMTNPPKPPTDNVIVLAYTFGPDGAEFDPALTLTMSYDPTSLPANVKEGDLYVSYFDGTNWQTLDGTPDTSAHTITVSISHFSSYILLGKISQPPVVTTAATTTPPVVTTPIATTSTTSPAPTSTTTPIITSTTPTTAPVPPVALSSTTTTEVTGTTFPVGLIIGIIAAVLIIAAALAVIIRRRSGPGNSQGPTDKL